MPIKDVINSYAKNPAKIIKNIIFRNIVKPSDMKHVFIIGAPRSGTTLVQSVIMANKHVSSFDQETGFFMYRDLFTNTMDIPDLEFNEICRKSTDIVNMFDQVALFKIQQDDGLLFLEKTPQHVFFIKKLIRYFPNSKFIHITRDCRDALVSAQNFSKIEQGKNIVSYIKYWKKCINARNSINSDNIIDIKYEDFVDSPDEITRKIMSFIGLGYSKDQIDPAYFSRNNRSGSEGFKKLAKPIDNNSVGRWKSTLSSGDLNIINALVKDELQLLGYCG